LSQFPKLKSRVIVFSNNFYMLQHCKVFINIHLQINSEIPVIVRYKMSQKAPVSKTWSLAGDTIESQLALDGTNIISQLIH
jgi:hypothetical protein